MTTLEIEVSDEALRQARLALQSLPADATVSLRCNAITTAVRALSAYRDARSPSMQQQVSRVEGGDDAS